MFPLSAIAFQSIAARWVGVVYTGKINVLGQKAYLLSSFQPSLLVSLLLNETKVLYMSPFVVFCIIKY